MTAVSAHGPYRDELVSAAQEWHRDAGAAVGFDDIEDGRFGRPSLTTVAPDKACNANTTIELLATRLRRRSPPPPPQEITAGHRLIVRESSSAAHTH